MYLMQQNCMLKSGLRWYILCYVMCNIKINTGPHFFKSHVAAVLNSAGVAGLHRPFHLSGTPGGPAGVHRKCLRASLPVGHLGGRS